MGAAEVRKWLLEPSQPSVRYRALTELFDRRPDDAEARESREQIPRTGWAAEILAGRDTAGWWASSESLYRPKYVSTNWRMIVLSDLGLTREHRDVRASAELWMAGMPLRGGGVGGNSKGTGHHCAVGNIARSLIRLGYGGDPRVRRSLEWLVETASPLGGWSCFGSGRNLDSWEGLSALAAIPRAERSAAMDRVVDRAVEFYLERELHRQSGRYPPWERFHYPVHYYYDVLVGLDLMTRLGRADDPRLRWGLERLRSKRRRDGRWNLDAVHPDVSGAMERWFASHPKDRPIPWSLERAGAPSKMVTLTALTVLARVDGTSDDRA